MTTVILSKSLTKCIMLCCCLLISIVSCVKIKPTAAIEALKTSGSGTVEAPSNDAIQIGDGGLLSGKICGPPCFWNIVPGETKKAEVIQTLEDRNIYHSCQASNENASLGAGISCHQDGANYWTRIDIIFRKGADVVESIGFGPSQQMLIKDVVAKYGNPEFVEILEDGTIEHPTAQMILYYDKISAFLSLPTQNDTSYYVGPDINIIYVVYWDAESITKILKDSSNIILPWNGFGKYK